MISEASAPNPSDNYYAKGSPLHGETTLLAFQDAGFSAQSIDEILSKGVYLTSAVKCAKIAYNIKSATIEACSFLLENELDQFIQLRGILLMGDVAIKSLNMIAKRQGLRYVIPATPTYKLREKIFYFRELRVFPSYLQAGPSFFIEKSKRKMIAEDIAKAMSLLN